jgi:hypothetical protein
VSGAPLRFLGVILGSWMAVRAVVLFSALEPAEEVPFRAIIKPASAAPAPPSIVAAPALPAKSYAVFVEPTRPERLPPLRATIETKQFASSGVASTGESDRGVALTQAVPDAAPPASWRPSLGQAPTTSLPSRSSISAWALVRSGGERQLAAGGVLGGSQAGMRATYWLRNGLALSGRAYAPINEPEGAELALGIEWRPLRQVPVRVLAERRQAIGREGRSAFALLAHGGVSDQPLIGPVTLDAYAQAGVVGARSRDGFVDGAVRLGAPVAGDLSVGVGAWGAAQPGVSRFDIGPQASYRLPVLGATMRLSAEWRVRVAGDARPGSGPALTLSTDF